MSLDVMDLSLVFFHLVHILCLGCVTAMARRLLSTKWWISSETILRLSLLSLLTTTVVVEYQVRLSQLLQNRLLLSFCVLREVSAVSILYLASHFRPVIMASCALFTSGSTASCSIWKSRALPNLNSSTSDFVGSFSFVDELYNATFVKDLGTPNRFFNYLLFKHSIFSILKSDTSYICISHANLGIKPK